VEFGAGAEDAHRDLAAVGGHELADRPDGGTGGWIGELSHGGYGGAHL